MCSDGAHKAADSAPVHGEGWSLSRELGDTESRLSYEGHQWLLPGIVGDHISRHSGVRSLLFFLLRNDELHSREEGNNERRTKSSDDLSVCVWWPNGNDHVDYQLSSGPCQDQDSTGRIGWDRETVQELVGLFHEGMERGRAEREGGSLVNQPVFFYACTWERKTVRPNSPCL